MKPAKLLYDEPDGVVETANGAVYLTFRQPGMPPIEVRMSLALALVIGHALVSAE